MDLIYFAASFTVCDSLYAPVCTMFQSLCVISPVYFPLQTLYFSQCELSSEVHQPLQVAAVHNVSILASEDHFQCHIVKCRDLDLTDGNSCKLNSRLLHLAMLLSVMLQSALDSVALGRRLVEAHSSSARAAVAAEVHLPGQLTHLDHWNNFTTSSSPAVLVNMFW